MTILTALTSLVALLINPEPFDLQDVNAVAIMFRKDFFQYRNLAQRWTKTYA